MRQQPPIGYVHVWRPGVLALSSAAYSAAEASGSVTITVTRSGDTDGAVSCDYATSNGTATAGSDYTAASGTLNWANGEGGDKTFSITLIDDAAQEVDETVNITLSNPTGGAELGLASAVLTITSEDIETPAEILAVGTASGLTLYDMSDMSIFAPPGVVPADCYAVAFSPDKTIMAVGTTVSPYIKLYDCTTWQPIAGPATIPTGFVDSIAFNPAGTLMAVGFGGASTPRVRVYNTTTWAVVASPAPPSSQFTSAPTVAFSPDGTILTCATGLSDHLNTFNTTTWAAASEPSGGNEPGAGCVSLSYKADGTRLAVGIIGGALVYNTSTWAKVTIPDPPSNTAFAAAYSPNSSWLALGDDRTVPSVRTIGIYNGGTLARLADPAVIPPGYVNAMTFKPNSAVLAVGHETTPFITLYNTADWSKRANPATLPPSAAVALAIRIAP